MLTLDYCTSMITTFKSTNQSKIIKVILIKYKGEDNAQNKNDFDVRNRASNNARGDELDHGTEAGIRGLQFRRAGNFGHRALQPERNKGKHPADKGHD